MDLRVKSFFSFLVFLAYGVCHGATLELKIDVTNPRNQPQVKEVRSNLPARVGTNAILSLDGLELKYDLQNDIYQVYTSVELDPKETRTFRVQIKDIWFIPDDKLDQYLNHADRLLKSLKGTAFIENAQKLHASVTGNIAEIREEQNKSSIESGTRPIMHIAAYETNLDVLDLVKKDLAHMENLVLGTGKDPEMIIDPGRAGAKGEDVETERLKPEDYRQAVIELIIRNSSPDENRTIKHKHLLPGEIKPDDIIDAAGLRVLPEPASGATYLVVDGVELKPGESRTYEIKIRDKWNINEPRIVNLEQRVQNIRGRISAQESFESIENALADIEQGLELIRSQDGPSELNEQYVQFYRGQDKRIDLLERKLGRIEAALRPATSGSKLGFDVKPPSRKNTWLIIYVILGFLAVMSLLFFLRWFSKSEAERIFEGSSEENRGE